MPVPYEELEGSPEIDLSRRGGSGKRSVKIQWPLITAFISEIFPDPLLTGYLYGAVMPGFPWMVALKLGVKPFDERRARYDTDDWTFWHDFARIDVEYGVPTDDQQQQSGPSGDGTGPGGTEGSTGGQEVSFVSHKVDVGGEFITWPTNALKWEQPVRNADVDPNNPQVVQGQAWETTTTAVVLSDDTTVKVAGFFIPNQRGMIATVAAEKMQILSYVTNRDGTIALNVKRGFQGTTPAGCTSGTRVVVETPSAAAKALYVVNSNVPNSITVPLFEHTIEWNYVSEPPWTTMRLCLGKTNAYWYAGAAPECLLFNGAQASREITSSGAKTWKLSYKLSEKNVNAIDPNNPQGWNHFLRPDGDKAGTFQRLDRQVTLSNGEPPTTTLTAPLTADATFCLPADSGFPFPQAGQFLIKIANEILAVTGFIDADTWAVLRGVRNTTPAVHPSGAVVEQVSGGVYDVCDLRYLFLV